MSNNDVFCGTCEETIDSSPLTCNRCKRCFHEKCVKLNENLLYWFCPKCPPAHLNPPSAPKPNRVRSVTSRSNVSNKAKSATSSKAEAQLKLIEEQELLLKTQTQEKEAAIAEKLRINEEREKFLKQQEDEMKERHLQQQQLLRKKSELLDTIRDSRQGSEHSSVRSDDSSLKMRQQRLQQWKTTFDAGLPQIGNSTAVQPGQGLATNVGADSNQVKSTAAANIIPNNNSLLMNHTSFIGMKEAYELPIFDGSVEKWPVFICKFESTSPSFTSEVNLVRLQHSLRGAAKAAVEDLLTMPSNITIIIETLRSFFGRPEFIINSLLEKLRKESKLRMDDFDGIISFALQVRNICSTMKAATLSEHLWNPMLLQELVDKLPCQYKVNWAEYKVNIQAVNLEVFSAWVYEKAMALASVLTKPPQLAKKSGPKSVNIHQTISKPNDSHTRSVCRVCGDTCKIISECDKFMAMSYNDRWATLKLHDLCRCCLRSHRGKCRVSKACGKDGCVFKHNSLLHNDQREPTKDSVVHNDDRGSSGELMNAEVNSHNSTNSCVRFKILPVTLHGKNKKVETFAILDDGSSVTLIEDDLANELDIQDSVQDPLCLKWTSDEIREEHMSKRFDTQISGSRNTNKSFQLINVRTVNKLHLPMQSINAESIKQKFPYLKNIPLVSYFDKRPKLLIGLDNSVLMLSSKSKSGGIADPIAIKTCLGWVVYGGGHEKVPSVLHVCNCESSAEQELTSLVKEFITLDNLTVSNKRMVSTDEQRAAELLNNVTTFDGSRYECGLLWKHDNVKLPDSYNMALRRLQCLEKKFRRDPELKQTLQQQIQSYSDKGYIRLLTKEEVDSNRDKCWYLPIFTVKNPNKPNKVRIVWDAAATVQGISLNSILLKGPDLLVSLCGVLMRFRERRWAITGDICEMFHQIRVKPQDQQYQRFLWRDNCLTPPQVYVMKVVTFGATCSPALAQHVKNSNALKYKTSHHSAYTAIVQNHYVDDWLESVESEEQALQLANEVKEIHAKGGFEMRQWISNSPKIMSALGAKEEAKDLNLFSEVLAEKVLGMWWSVKEDCFTYSLRFNKGDKDVLEGKRTPSKRQLLRIIMSVYDPLGMLAHFMAYAKILMQLIWRRGVKWDEEIPEDLESFWLEWLKMLPKIEDIRIPRFYFMAASENFDNSNLELHIFVDGSEEGYAAVAYLRAVSNEGVIVCKIISAKSRVAPLKHHSVPRLELLAAVLGVRLASTIEKEHTIKFKRRLFWSDSRTVCSWIRSQHRRYKQYVACRIGEILESSNESEWRWLPTANNIADAATRMKLMDISSDCEWFCGPNFLYQTNYLYNSIDESFQTDEEIRPSEIHQVLLHHAGVLSDRFSTWIKLLRTNAFVHRYINNLKAKSKQQVTQTGSLQQSEYEAAEITVLRQAQREGFPDEIVDLETSNPSRVSKKSKLYKLLPYLDNNGIMRQKGRLDEAQHLTGDVKRPIILPHNHHVTDLLVQWYHRRYHHHNHETVVNEMRQKFYYPPLRKDLRRLREKNCQKCKNELAKPQPPEMANLPRCRLQNFTRPFTYVGIDYFGPIVVCIGRRNEKRWGVLATCLTFRAIHLESVHTLSTSSCILALRNFINRRGQPREIFSDNATTFKGASRELKQLVLELDRDALTTEFNSSSMTWNFNPPTAAHMGGAWERLIGMVKKNLYYVTNLQNIQDELFRSLLIEIESIVNSRPLTYVPIDSGASEAITPNHFLLGSSSGYKPSGSYNVEGHHLRTSWLVSQQLTEIFYKRFLKEVIPSLNRRQKWYESGRDLKVDDIVLLLNDNVPKYQFPKGRVLKVYPGRDGRVRSASIQTSQGIYDRPVAKLAILDVYSDESKTVEPRDPTDFTVGSVTATQLATLDSSTTHGENQTD